MKLPELNDVWRRKGTGRYCEVVQIDQGSYGAVVEVRYFSDAKHGRWWVKDFIQEFEFERVGEVGD